MRSQPILALALAAFLSTLAPAQVTQRVNLDSFGAQAAGTSIEQPSLSSDGRYIAFQSSAANLVPSDTNAAIDVFVRDRQLGTTVRASLDSSGAEGSGESITPAISSDGRYVAFASTAQNLVAGDTNGVYDIFVHDLQTGVTERVSVDSSAVQSDGDSFHPFVSSDGRYVVFSSEATNLVAGDTNGRRDIFVRDRQTNTTERVSVDSSGAQANGDSGLHPYISSDGRYVALYSGATNLVAGDVNGAFDAFLRDRLLATTVIASLDSSGAQANSNCSLTSVSDDGRYLAFQSAATNLVPADTNASIDVFVRDLVSATTERISVDSAGTQSDDNTYYPTISADGLFVVFFGEATNLVAGDTNNQRDVFVRDLQADTTSRVSVTAAGVQGNGDCTYYPTISPDGRFVAFSGASSNLVQSDTNGDFDVFLHDRNAGSPFASFCHPGEAGVMVCPCANPPGSIGAGCDNSSTTGGAVLVAQGGAYLSSDSLVFYTSGEKPTALSILLQGSTAIPAGVPYGQGVRCVGGTLRRLFIKSASGGSITAPNFLAGDLTVHARSAALGATLTAGSTRPYMVYYRDPNVLGGCPTVSTFNTTQGRLVTWLP